MKCFIELWKAKKTWKELSKEERGNYLAQIGPHMQALTEKGVEFGAWGENDPDTSNRINYDFFGIWMFPKPEMAKEFEQVIEAAGWYNYFEQVNVSGTALTPQEVIGKMLDL